MRIASTVHVFLPTSHCSSSTTSTNHQCLVDVGADHKRGYCMQPWNNGTFKMDASRAAVKPVGPRPGGAGPRAFQKEAALTPSAAAPGAKKGWDPSVHVCLSLCLSVCLSAFQPCLARSHQVRPGLTCAGYYSNLLAQVVTLDATSHWVICWSGHQVL